MLRKNKSDKKQMALLSQFLRRVVRATNATPHQDDDDDDGGGGGDHGSSSDFCDGHAHPQDTILFIFFGLFLGVLTKKLIDAFRIPIPYTVRYAMGDSVCVGGGSECVFQGESLFVCLSESVRLFVCA